MSLIAPVFVFAQSRISSTPRVDRSLPVFAAVVQSVADSAKSILADFDPVTTATVEPRPLRTRVISGETAVNAVLEAGSPELDSLSAAVLTGRLRALRHAHLEPGDLTTLNDCWGSGPTAPEDPPRGRRGERCPANPTVIVSLGILSQTTSRATVQVMILAGPIRRATITPYVMRLTGRGWRLMKKGTTVIIE